MFHGCFTALVTPFDPDGAIDWPAFDRLIERQIGAGVHGLVACGTTAESVTLSGEEWRAVALRTIQKARGRVPVVVGSGTNDTRESIARTHFAKAEGADAAMIVCPYYNKPTQSGLIAHVEAIADAVEIPLILYNVPSRTVADLAPASVAVLARHPNVLGLKDATADMARVASYRAMCPEGFVLFSGDDASQIGFMAMGGDGVISVTSNVAPKRVVALQAAALAGDFARARAENAQLAQLHEALLKETSPAPAKACLAALGLCGDHLRLPLVAATAALRPLLAEALAACGATVDG